MSGWFFQVFAQAKKLNLLRVQIILKYCLHCEMCKFISFHLDKEHAGKPTQQKNTGREISDQSTADVLQHSQNASESAELEVDRSSLILPLSENIIPGSTNTAVESLYCQICKGSVSIYGNGAREILRHYATEKHLRKDQRWRYEHLSTVDLVTKTVQHQVRGNDDKVLTPFQLQLELPLFIDAELVDIGENSFSTTGF